MKNKPCPWCGSINLSASESESPKFWAVYCWAVYCECGIHGPEVRVLIKATEAKKSKLAFDAWNNRAINK